MLKRRLSALVADPEFGRQMRFVTGPRQAGKTTLARRILAEGGYDHLYFNWDTRAVRDRFRRDPYFFESALRNASQGGGIPWSCLDEIHKMPKWKNILKDFFDRFESVGRFIVTGSARLDWFKRSGDSLAGRYFLYRLFPLCLNECVTGNPSCPAPTPLAVDFIRSVMDRAITGEEALDQLLQFGGFPEPFTRASSRFHLRWQRDILDRVLREDIRDLTRITTVEHLAHYLQLLPLRVGSPLSLNALREDLECSHTAVRSATMALQFVYVLFLVPPYHERLARSLRKEKKAYFYDWSRVPDPAARFENYVALELKTLVEFWNDAGLANADLWYIRTRDGRETDFLVTLEGKPWCLFETKLSDGSLASHHFSHSRALGDIPVVQVTRAPGVNRRDGEAGFRVSAGRFFA